MVMILLINTNNIWKEIEQANNVKLCRGIFSRTGVCSDQISSNNALKFWGSDGCFCALRVSGDHTNTTWRQFDLKQRLFNLFSLGLYIFYTLW